MTGIESRRVPPQDRPLSPEQVHVLQLVREGENVFFTGPAGTGKSFLLNKIIKELRPDPKIIGGVAITASTGIAGLNIGGRTLHSFAGIGLGTQPAEELVRQIQKALNVHMRWRTTQVLIIDEISMIDGVLFDKLEFIARKIRNSEKPFGGIQLVLSGDFFQLPPVPEQTFNRKVPASYAFEAKSWNSCIPQPIFLTKVFRQKDDAFVRILSNMRHGLVTSGDVEQLKALSRKINYPDGIEPSELFPRKNDVEACNQKRLRALPGPEYAYHAMDSAGYSMTGFPISHKEATKLLDRMITPAGLLFRVGAQVMLTKNIKEGRLVNGSIGKISTFMTLAEAQVKRIEIPQNLTGHKDSSKKEVPITCIPNDEMRPLTGHTFRRNELWPVVEFPRSANTITDDEDNGQTPLPPDVLLCIAQEFTIQGPVGNMEARRIQVPLILAWALSIHKSQGQTLQRVKIDLANVFESGQAYVAISRATSMEGLELHNFEREKVTVHPRVLEWQKHWESSA